MKKNVIALMLSFVVATGSICAAPVFAAETGATAVESGMEEADEGEEAPENEQPEGELAELDEPEEEPVDINEQEETEEQSAEETDEANDATADLPEDTQEQFGDNEPDYSEPEDDQQDAISEETAEPEEVSKESQNSDEGVINIEGTCGEDVTWVLTGTDQDLTLTISGTGRMRDFEYTTNWTQYNTGIRKVVIEDGVTGIGKNVFYHFYALEEIVIPNSVTSIGDYAFVECYKLDNVTIPNGVISLGASVFYRCSGLKSIMIPDTVTSIGSAVFYECYGLQNLSIPNGVTSIGDYAFYKCSSLPEISIPDSTTSIGKWAFGYCSSLTSIELPSATTQIADCLLSGCTNLKNINLPSGVTTIGKSAFGDCSSLTGINIPDTVTSIGESAFSGCSSLTSVIIPDSVTSIGGSAFSHCYALASISIPNSVTSIGYAAFKYCRSLTGIILPSNLNKIGNNLFYGCDGFINITIPDNVTSIGEYAFYGCNNLANVIIPASVTSIGEYAFEYCSSLTQVTIPESVTSIKSHTFSGCTSLNEVNLPDGVTSIGDYVFYECSSLSEISIPDSVTSIGICAFGGCSSLIEISIPNGVAQLSDALFDRCENLQSIYIPSSVTRIGRTVFQCCHNLADISIPENVTYIGEFAFNACWSITNVIIPDGITQIAKNTFSDCIGLTEISIPDGVTSIGEDAFYGCISLAKAVIPCSVISIDKYAFYQEKYSVPIEELTIYGYLGTYAEQYANENGIPFIAINGMSWEDGTGFTHYYTIALQATSTGRFITCDVGAKDNQGRYSKMDKPDLNADATKIGAYEQFELVPCSDGSYALRSVVSRKFFSMYIDSEGIKQFGFCEDFVGDFEKLILTKGSKGKIKSKGFNLWLYVVNGKLSITINEDKAEVFNQILVDDNSYSDEFSILAKDEWFNLYNQGLGGYYNIQWDVGQNKTNNAKTLENLGYTLMNEDGQFGRDYIQIDNMQCFVAYKKTNDFYEVVIAFQGTGGYENGEWWHIWDEDWWRDSGSNMTGNGETNAQGQHVGYTDMAEKLHEKETRIYDYSKSINLNQLIGKAMDGKAHFTLLGHSMGGAIAQCYAIRLANKGVKKEEITGRTFNSALAVNKDDTAFEDWFNLCVSTDTVTNGLVPGSIIHYGIHRLGQTIWLYDNIPDIGTGHIPVVNISYDKHNLDKSLYGILHNIWEAKKCDHIWDEGEIIVVPTEQNEGERKRTCTICEATKIEIITLINGISVNGLGKQYYTGKAIEPAIVVMLGDKKLKENKDYEVTYENNIDVGTANVFITGKGAYYGTVKKTFKIVQPAAPSISSVIAGKTGITVKWSEVSDANKYVVFRKTGNGGWKRLGVTTSTSFTDKTAIAGYRFTYTVRCVADDEQTYVSGFDSIGKSITYAEIPALGTVKNTETGVKFTWSKAKGAVKYRIFRKTGGGGWKKLADTTALSYLDKTAVSGYKFTYSVRCISSDGKQYTSWFDSAGKVAVFAARPAISGISSPKAKQITVKWGKVASITGYQIQCSLSRTFASGVKTVAVKSATAVNKTFSVMTSKKKYYVRMRAYKTVSGKTYYSAWSTVKNVTVK